MERSTGNLWDMGTDAHWCGYPMNQTKVLRGTVGVRGPKNDAHEVAAAVQGVLASAHKGTNGLTKCRTVRRNRSYRGMTNAYIGH